MIIIAPTQIQTISTRTSSYASQCFTVSKFNLGIILSLSIATMEWQHRTLTSLWTVISRCRCMSAPCVAQHFASCASYVSLCIRWRLMQPRQVVVGRISSLLQPLFYTAFTTSCSGAYRPYRMLQHAWSLAPKGVTWPHHPGLAATILVTSKTVSGI